MSLFSQLGRFRLLVCRQAIRTLGCSLNHGLRLERVTDASFIGDTLDDGEEIVLEIHLVFKRADTLVSYVGKHLEDWHEVNLATRERD